MQTIYTFFIALTVLMLAYYGWQYMKQKWRGQIPGRAQPGTGRSAASRTEPDRPASIGDPSVAAAAMLYAVATEDGPLSGAEERLILALLERIVGLAPDAARSSLARGRRLAEGTTGDLTSRLHQLKGPIDVACTSTEKEELIAMLNEIAGSTLESMRSVREGIGRITVTLREG
jgi:uncharacterized tellurite resistance protein B-like protein